MSAFQVIFRKKLDTKIRLDSVTIGYDDFLNCIGEKVSMQRFDKYSGGLDTISNKTGHTSLYTTWNDIEIMFHVSHLIPDAPNDVQKIEKKRHIGNGN